MNRPCDIALRNALSRGALIRQGTCWRFGRRLFASETVRRAIEAGAAVRTDDDTIEAAA